MADDSDSAAYLMQVMRDMSPEPFDAVPQAAMGGVVATDEWMVNEPYYIHPARHTQPLPSPQPHRAIAAKPPDTVEELHNPDFWKRLESWWREAVNWMLALVDGTWPLPEAARRFLRRQRGSLQATISTDCLGRATGLPGNHCAVRLYHAPGKHVECGVASRPVEGIHRPGGNLTRMRWGRPQRGHSPPVLLVPSPALAGRRLSDVCRRPLQAARRRLLCVVREPRFLPVPHQRSKP